MAKKKRKILKVLNPISNLLVNSESVSKIVETAAPIIKENLDRYHENQKKLIPLSNVVNLTITDAKKHLESLGFSVNILLAEPNNRFSKLSSDTVVKMEPKSGKLPKGALIKLYYVNEEIIEQSKTTSFVEIPNVIGLPSEKAEEMLVSKGFEVIKPESKPKKEYAKEKPGIVVNMEPKPSVVKKTAKIGSIIRLFVLNQETIDESKELLISDTKKIKFDHLLKNPILKKSKN